MTLVKRRNLFLLIGAIVVLGCGSASDVPKTVNDAYHNKDTGAPPPAGAMNAPGGKAFIGQPSSVPLPNGEKAPGPPPGATAGPAGNTTGK